MRHEVLGKETFLYTLDPRVKLLVLFLFAWKVALSYDFLEIFALLPYVLLLLFPLRENFLKVLKILLSADLFLLFLVFTSFFYGKEGVKVGMLLFLKSNEILLVSIALLATSEPFQIFRAFRSFYIPKKLVQLFFLTFRYIVTVYEEYKVLLRSAKCRGFRPKTNVFTYKTYGYILANLLVKSYLRADKIYKAMLCRGFKGEFPVYKELKMKEKDYAFGFLSLLFLLLVELWSLSGQRTFL